MTTDSLLAFVNQAEAQGAHQAFEIAFCVNGWDFGIDLFEQVESLLDAHFLTALTKFLTLFLLMRVNVILREPVLCVNFELQSEVALLLDRRGAAGLELTPQGG